MKPSEIKVGKTYAKKGNALHSRTVEKIVPGLMQKLDVVYHWPETNIGGICGLTYFASWAGSEVKEDE